MAFKIKEYFCYLLALWRFVKRRFVADACAYRASALTFTTLLSIVPLMAVSFTVLAAFPAFRNLGEQIQQFIFTNFVAASGKQILSRLQEFTQQANQLSWLGFATLILTAVLVLFTAEKAFNAIWQVKRRRHVISAFLLYWAVLTLMPILAGISFLFSSYLFRLPLLSHLFSAGSRFGIWSLSFVSIILAFTILYVALPHTRVRIKHALIGAVIAALLFECAKSVFAFYIRTFSTYEILYGAIASIPIFLLWVYLSWLIILFGAEISHALSQTHHIRSRKKLDGFTHAIRWLGYLWQAQKKGKALSLSELINRDRESYLVEPVTLLETLQALGWVQMTTKARYVLSQDLHALSLWEAYQTLPWPLPKQLLDDHLNSYLEPISEKMKQTFTIPLAQLYQ